MMLLFFKAQEQFGTDLLSSCVSRNRSGSPYRCFSTLFMIALAAFLNSLPWLGKFFLALAPFSICAISCITVQMSCLSDVNAFGEIHTKKSFFSNVPQELVIPRHGFIRSNWFASRYSSQLAHPGELVVIFCNRSLKFLLRLVVIGILAAYVPVG